MRYPSIKRIRTYLNVSLDSAKDIRSILENQKINYLTKLRRISIVMEAHGVEYISHRKDTYYVQYGIEYINVGDLYTPTLYYNHELQSFAVGDLGTVIEKKFRNLGGY